MPSGSLALFRAQQALGRCHYLFKSEQKRVPLKPCTWVSTCPVCRGLKSGGVGPVTVAEARGVTNVEVKVKWGKKKGKK